MNTIKALINKWFWNAVTALFGVLPQPVTTPIYSPSTPPVMTKLATVYLDYNTGHALFDGGVTAWMDKINGTIIHKIDAFEALEEANAVEQWAAYYKLPIDVVSAGLGVESVLDPHCQNGNLGPTESNANNPTNLAGYDMGVGQFKLGELLGNEGITTIGQAANFAFDPIKAIPYYCKVMAGLVAWAQAIIAADPSPSLRDPRFSNAYVLATCAYNFGRSGVLETYYYKGTFPDGQDGRKNHGVAFLGDVDYFARAIDMPPSVKVS